MGDDGERARDDATRERADAARDRILDAHADVVAGVVDAADAVAAGWTRSTVADRAAVVEPLRSELRARDLVATLPAVLADAVAAAGYDLPAEPVPAPPYVVVTGRGPVLRGTVSDGRLVVVLATFRVERDPVRYVRTGDSPESVVEVTFVSG